MVSDVHIELGPRSYDIRIGPGILDEREEFLPWIRGKQVFVVTNEIVAPLYLDRLLDNFADLEVHSLVLPDGEAVKDLKTFGTILDGMLAVPCDRSATVIALGGGVIGDLAGFAAASYQRGVGFIQVPTTLLSQVDSSVGGKTGVNHARGKNMIGAFYQPRRVLIDTETLSTLPRRELAAGMAEVVKYGLINDAPLFSWLEENMESVMALESTAVEYVISRSCRNKASIVERDERETGVRALLNLGHTFGHAIETATGYRTWLHGEAVATGMVMAAHLSMAMGRLDETDCERISALLSRAGLPVAPFSGVMAVRMRELMQADKKVQMGRLRLVLLQRIGQADVVEGVEEDRIMDTLREFCLDG